LAFIHPGTGEAVQFESTLPADLAGRLKTLKPVAEDVL
jgi:hypothetical protein